ncbi:hypothetical protein ACH470_07360 [Streptomyces bottropensis]|uniref:hypothetical protein n=1 Tax=Streptomyces bottropensis TaxID=42235 RepID=UPI003795D880
MFPGNSRRILAVVALVALAAVPLACDSPPGKAKREVPDFNGDGYADLAAPGTLSTVDGVQRAGAVSVVYGSRSGLDTEHTQVVSRATKGALGRLAARGTGFGDSPVARDFDGDGFTDLAVTVSTDADDHHGTVVLWGSSVGLSGGTTLPGGWGLHGGDFDGDGQADLLLDSYYGGDRRDGDGPTVLYGPLSRDGKARRKDSLGTDSWGDDIGPRGILVGDLTGDGRDDVVTSQGFEEMQEHGRLFRGDEDGLEHTSDDINAYNSNGVVADFDGDGYGDLVVREVGMVSEDSESRPGELRVFRGSDEGPGSRAQRITRETLSLPGHDEQTAGDGFGDVLAAADINGDGYADLAIGLPGEEETVQDTGAVVLLLGSKKGLTASGAQVITQDTPGVPGRGEQGDGFGAALRTGDLNHDGYPDLAVGAPGENGTVQKSGAVWILNGTAQGLSVTNVTSFGPAALGAPEKGYDGTDLDVKGTYFGGNFTASEDGCVAVDTAPAQEGENGGFSCALPEGDDMSRWAFSAGIMAAGGSLLLFVGYRRKKAPHTGLRKTPWWARFEREPRPPVGQ